MLGAGGTTSFDQVLAESVKDTTPLPSLELAIGFTSGGGGVAPSLSQVNGVFLPGERNPVAAYQRLASRVSTGAAGQGRGLRRSAPCAPSAACSIPCAPTSPPSARAWAAPSGPSSTSTSNRCATWRRAWATSPPIWPPPRPAARCCRPRAPPTSWPGSTTCRR